MTLYGATFGMLYAVHVLNPHTPNTIICVPLYYYLHTPGTFCVPPGAQNPRLINTVIDKKFQLLTNIC